MADEARAAVARIPAAVTNLRDFTTGVGPRFHACFVYIEMVFASEDIILAWKLMSSFSHAVGRPLRTALPAVRGFSLFVLLFWSGISDGAGIGLTQLTPAHSWQRLEFALTNLPAVSNPFDLDLIRVDATFTSPSGKMVTVPGFWYQAYVRSLSGGLEKDTPSGSAGWRIRFTPTEAGANSISVLVVTNGQTAGPPITAGFNVASDSPASRVGYVMISPAGRYFQTGDGQALPLRGQDVAWPSGLGTYDYDNYFSSMQPAGENFARIWMWPTSFGIECGPSNLNNYALAPAWQLDYVLQLAEQKGIYLQLALDYHGMFATQPDYWGGNNYWPQNPYNGTNGGPCSVANDFFTSSAAIKIYQKRLRYLVGRYGYSQNLLGWEFFNEIDNDYSFLNASNVATWHSIMGSWLHTNDPFGHLVTTSLTSALGHPEIWNLPQLDYASQHSYNEANPATSLAADAQTFLTRFGKPVMVGEFGTSWQGWNRNNDPYLRGFRQGLWGGALGGSVGTAMSWWWETIASENDYPIYSALNSVLGRTGWGTGAWTNAQFQTSGSPPVTVGSLVGGQPFNVQLFLDGNWGDLVSGRLAIPYSQAAGSSAGVLESFVHGSAHANLKTPFQLSAWFSTNATLVMHLNSVSSGAIMTVAVDGVQKFSTNLANLDGGTTVDEEYNIDIPVSIPSGKHLVQIANAGLDWFYLDWVELTQLLPSTYSGNWQPSPAAIGLCGAHESLLYVVAPWVSFPASATNAVLPVQQAQSVTLTQWPQGTFTAEWYDPVSASFIGLTEATTTNSLLTVPLPAFSEDLAAIIYPLPKLSVLGFGSGNVLQLRLNSQTGGRYSIEQSTNLTDWTTLVSVTNVTGSDTFSAWPLNVGPLDFFRATHFR